MGKVGLDLGFQAEPGFVVGRFIARLTRNLLPYYYVICNPSRAGIDTPASVTKNAVNIKNNAVFIQVELSV